MASQNDNSRITENHPWVRNFGPTSKRPTTDLIAGQLYNNTTTGYLESYDGSGWVPKTTAKGLWASRPGSPADGQAYLATDITDAVGIGTEFTWESSISKWLTTQPYYWQPPFDPGLTFRIAANTTLVRDDNPERTLDIYLISLSMSSDIAATYDANNYWTFQLFSISSAGVATNVGAAQSTWQGGRSASTRYPNVYNINTQFTAANFASWRVDLAKAGSGLNPGGITPNPPKLFCRYVGP